MIKLHDYTLSGSCYKVRLLLNILGVEYEQITVDFYPVREHRRPEFLKLNPLGQIPLLEDGDFLLRDAQAILVYIAAKYDLTGKWYPNKPDVMATVAMWLSFAGGEIMNASAARLHDVFGYSFDIDEKRESAYQAFRVLDDHLTHAEIDGQQWLATTYPTIADIACFPYVALSSEGGISLSHFHAIQRWLDRVKALPGFIEMPGIFSMAKAS